jgi:hypothetical protein
MNLLSENIFEQMMAVVTDGHHVRTKADSLYTHSRCFIQEKKYLLEYFLMMNDLLNI